MKVRCIEAYPFTDVLTDGREYEVLSEVDGADGGLWRVMTDDIAGVARSFYKWRFEVVGDDHQAALLQAFDG